MNPDNDEARESSAEASQGVETGKKAVVAFVAPTSPSLVATSPSQMTLQWKELQLKSPEDEAQPEGLSINYALLMRLETRETSTSGRWSCAYLGPQLIEQVKGLRPGKSYSFRLEIRFKVPEDASFEVSDVASSETVTFSTPATVPTEPRQIGLGNRAHNTLTVKWQPPSECGGPDVQTYTLAMSPSSESCAAAMPFSAYEQDFHEVYRGSECRWRVYPLPPGQQYSFIVKATNAVGDSKWSRPGVFTTKARVPSCVAAPTCKAVAEDTMRVSWDVPAGNGSPIMLYQCFMDNGPGSDFQLMYTGEHPSCERAGLKGGVQYQARVFATNEAGKSNAGDIGLLSLPALLPTAPASLTVSKITQTGFHLSWLPPEEDGGSPVDQYTVEMRPGTSAAVSQGIPDDWSRIHWSQGPEPPASCSFAGLTAGCKYMLRVRAHNQAGAGPYSRVANFKTASSIPYAPGMPWESGSHSDMLLLEWDPPSHDGGSEVLSYGIQVCEGTLEDRQTANFQDALTVDGTETRASLVGLKPAHTYHVRVLAANREGVSDFSSIGVCKTKPGPPGRPSSLYLSGKPTASSLPLAWDVPNNNGAEISGHLAQLWLASTLSTYPKQLIGMSRPGSESGIASEDGEEFLDGMSLPGAQNGPVSTTSEEAHSETGQKTRGGKSQRVLHSLACQGPECAAQGLEPDTEYLVKVRSSNSAGAGEWSQPVLFRTGPAPPSCPLHLTASGTSCSGMHLEWQPPQRHNGAAVASYRVQMSATKSRVSSQWVDVYTGSELQCKVGELRGGRSYSFRGCAENEKGWGPWSATASACTHPGPPDAPGAPSTSSRTSTAVKLSWQPPTSDNGAAVTSYRVEARTAGSPFSLVYTGSEAQCRATDLPPACEQTFRVQAANSAGASSWSPESTVQTKLLPPNPPQGVAVTLISGSQAQVSWEGSEGSSSRSVPVSHEVEASPLSGDATILKQTTKGAACNLVLSKLSPRVKYQVRVRSAGAGGCGHSDWSQPAIVSTPEISPEEAQVRQQGSISRSVSALSVDKEGSRPDKGALSDTEESKRKASKVPEMKQGPIARARPAKQGMFTSLTRLRRRYGNWLLGVLLSVSLIVLTHLMIRMS